jgi:hypothetical protein
MAPGKFNLPRTFGYWPSPNGSALVAKENKERTGNYHVPIKLNKPRMVEGAITTMPGFDYKKRRN